MAGDWIKMRVDLQSHPKVVRILSATQSDKFRVIGGLHAVWSVFDAHSENGVLKGYTPELMDHIIGWDGFSRALESVGWLSFDGNDSLQIPEFTEHNGQSAKRRAEDQKRKRDDRKRPQNVRNDSGQNSDDVRTREEKRREDINTKGARSASPVLPDWIPVAEWNAWLEMRKKQKKPPTNYALSLAIKSLGGFREEGHDIAAILSRSAFKGWTDLYPPTSGGQKIAVDA